MVGMKMNQKTIRTYDELINLPTFKERYEYLKLGGSVGEDTFGFDRYLNQIFYKTKEWQSIRNYVITRDNGCDLGVPGHEITSEKILVHHMNPISKEDIVNRSEILLDPKYLITTVLNTHNAIHYADDSFLLVDQPVERSKNDTCPWRR